jgi:hypothetical protein
VAATGLSEGEISVWFKGERARRGVIDLPKAEVKARLSQSIEILNKWFDERISDSNPFLLTGEKEELEEQTGLSPQQIKNWFLFERKRRGINTLD